MRKNNNADHFFCGFRLMSTTRKRSRSPGNTLIPSDDGSTEQAFFVDEDETAVDSKRPEELFSLDEGIVQLISPVCPKLPPCRYFQQGFCSAGSSCRFSHETTVEPPTSLKKLDVLCQFYPRGLCKEGTNCRFSHSIPASNDVTTRPVKAEPALCKYVSHPVNVSLVLGSSNH